MLIAFRSSKPGERRSLAQCRKPSGWLGRCVIWTMNRGHGRLTEWGLARVTIGAGDVILDVGCGGGRAVSRLAALATRGRVYGVDHSEASVAAARRANRGWIAEGRVEIQQGSVSALPYATATFDLATAVESHFWWPDLPADVKEIWRVLKPGGRVLLVAEFYNGGRHAKHAERLSAFTGMAAMTVGEHRELLSRAGFVDVDVVEEARRGWICAMGRRPA